MIDVDQDPLGHPGRRVAKDGALEVWAKPLEDGSLAVGLFNRGEHQATVTARWSDLGLSGTKDVRDLWRQKDFGPHKDRFQSDVARHGVVLVRRDGGPLRSRIPSRDGAPIAPTRVAMDARREYLVDRTLRQS